MKTCRCWLDDQTLRDVVREETEDRWEPLDMIGLSPPSTMEEEEDSTPPLKPHPVAA